MAIPLDYLKVNWSKAFEKYKLDGVIPTRRFNFPTETKRQIMRKMTEEEGREVELRVEGGESLMGVANAMRIPYVPLVWWLMMQHRLRKKKVRTFGFGPEVDAAGTVEEKLELIRERLVTEMLRRTGSKQKLGKLGMEEMGGMMRVVKDSMASLAVERYGEDGGGEKLQVVSEMPLDEDEGE